MRLSKKNKKAVVGVLCGLSETTAVYGELLLGTAAALAALRRATVGRRVGQRCGRTAPARAFVGRRGARRRRGVRLRGGAEAYLTADGLLLPCTPARRERDGAMRMMGGALGGGAPRRVIEYASVEIARE